MNLAPAELLHLLVHAALQPSWRRMRMDARRLPKKTPATMPASQYRFKKDKPIYDENAAYPDRVGRSGVCRSERSDLLLSIQFGYTLPWPTVFLVPVRVYWRAYRLAQSPLHGAGDHSSAPVERYAVSAILFCLNPS
jgi:hypothetical protein